MSTANSQIHAVSTVVTMVTNYVNRDANQTRIVYIGRLSLVGFSGRFYHGAYRTGVLVTIGIAALAGTAHLMFPAWCHHLEKSAPHRCWRVCGRALPACSLTFGPLSAQRLPCGYLGFIAECCAVCWAQPRAASTRHSGRGTLYQSTL